MDIVGRLIVSNRRNGATAMDALKHECESAIEDIKSDKAIPACKAHAAICRGIIALLRCKVADFDYAVQLERETKRSVAKIAGAVCIVAGAVYAVIDHLDVIVGIFK